MDSFLNQCVILLPLRLFFESVWYCSFWYMCKRVLTRLVFNCKHFSNSKIHAYSLVVTLSFPSDQTLIMANQCSVCIDLLIFLSQNPLRKVIPLVVNWNTQFNFILKKQINDRRKKMKIKENKTSYLDQKLFTKKVFAYVTINKFLFLTLISWNSFFQLFYSCYQRNFPEINTLFSHKKHIKLIMFYN